MKKLLLILVGVGITLTALAGVGFAFAQGSTPPPVSNPQMPDGFGGRGNRLGQIEDNPLHDLMTAAMADVFGLTVDEFETMRENGETLWTLAEAQGLTQEEFQAKMTEARENALQQAVEDGLISQEQADQMRSRETKMGNSGYGNKRDAGFEGKPGMDDGFLRDAMTAAMADVFGLTVDEFETMRENGETLWTLAEAQGLTQEEFQAKMTEARENALQQAVEDGLISQEQADQMRSRWENARGSKRGPGYGSQGSEFTPQDGFRGTRGGRGGGRQ